MSRFSFNSISVVDKCPFCKSFNIMHFIGKSEIFCADCQKKFTKQEAKEMTGIVKIVRGAYR